MTRTEYCDQVLSCVRRLTADERAAVRAELDGHIEDHMANLLDLGYDEQLAEERTMQRMGDPAEVGRELDKQYPLRWLILKRAATALMVVVCIQALLGLGMLGMVLESIAARVHPNEKMDMAAVEAAEELDYRIPVGNDILYVYRIAVGQSNDYSGRREAEVSFCVYDRIPGGIASQSLADGVQLENPRGETGRHGGGRGNWRVWYKQRYAPVAPGDTYVTLEYERFGESVSLYIELPEEVTP